MKKNLYILLIGTIVCLTACMSSDSWNVPSAKINNPIDVINLEDDFYSPTVSVSQLVKKYPLLFPPQTIDSIALNAIQIERMDTLSMAIYKDSKKKFPKEKRDSLQTAIEDMFVRVQYFFPTLKIKHLVTLVRNPYISNPEAFYDANMQAVFIPLDTYLGKDNIHYLGFDNYIRTYKRPNRILVDIAYSIASYVVKPNTDDTRNINTLVEEGKKMLVVDALLPTVSDEDKMNYTKEQMTFVKDHEGDLWVAHVKNDDLFITDHNFRPRFIEKAPFSKFYTDHDQEIPPQIGIWQGLQIMRKYTEKQNYTSLSKILDENDAELIYSQSNYKPK